MTITKSDWHEEFGGDVEKMKAKLKELQHELEELGREIGNLEDAIWDVEHSAEMDK